MDKLFYENLYIEKGARYVCGVDEVGRGPLAGPVTVCAVIMDLSKIVDGVDDSKKLSEKKRKTFSANSRSGCRYVDCERRPRSH
ncbi:MAG: hypothetical protein SPK20_01190, partial [Eubacteriales bacterium]|nr:hypothetical protein [Eubacteriales bacterium]